MKKYPIRLKDDFRGAKVYGKLVFKSGVDCLVEEPTYKGLMQLFSFRRNVTNGVIIVGSPIEEKKEEPKKTVKEEPKKEEKKA